MTTRPFITIKKCRVQDLEADDVVRVRALGEEWPTWRLWQSLSEAQRSEWGDLDLVDVQVPEQIPLPEIKLPSFP